MLVRKEVMSRRRCCCNVCSNETNYDSRNVRCCGINVCVFSVKVQCDRFKAKDRYEFFSDRQASKLDYDQKVLEKYLECQD